MKEPRWAVIFDFDGVIVDTERHHEICWQQVAAERNQSMTHSQYVSGFGIKNDRFISEILGWSYDPEEIAQIARRKEAIFQDHAATAVIDLIPGVEAFIHQLSEQNIPCAIASSSILKNIELVLSNTTLKNAFSSIISSEDVVQGKPHPEVFVKAAEKLALPPQRCVVIEDALLGVEGAVRAGTKVVAITTTFAKEKFESLEFCPDLIINGFHKWIFAEIEKWF